MNFVCLKANFALIRCGLKPDQQSDSGLLARCAPRGCWAAFQRAKCGCACIMSNRDTLTPLNFPPWGRNFVLGASVPDAWSGRLSSWCQNLELRGGSWSVCVCVCAVFLCACVCGSCCAANACLTHCVLLLAFVFKVEAFCFCLITSPLRHLSACVCACVLVPVFALSALTLRLGGETLSLARAYRMVDPVVSFISLRTMGVVLIRVHHGCGHAGNKKRYPWLKVSWRRQSSNVLHACGRT